MADNAAAPDLELSQPRADAAEWPIEPREPGAAADPNADGADSEPCHAREDTTRPAAIPNRISRNRALLALASDVPAAVISTQFGLHASTTSGWAKFSQRDWSAYTATRLTALSERTERGLARLPQKGFSIMADRLMLVFTNPVEGQDDAFNEWYDSRHFVDVLNVPGVVAAQRYDLAPMTPTAAERVDNRKSRKLGTPPLKIRLSQHIPGTAELGGVRCRRRMRRLPPVSVHGQLESL
jgi:hypothetical protein